MSSIFPKWMNALPTAGALGGVGGLLVVVVGTWYYATPDFWEVGYMPEQPSTGFSHQIHAGRLGMDCRYCHTNVEKSPKANVPAVSTCMNCHTDGRLANSQYQKVDFVREAWAADESIPWRQIHKLPDYVRHFPHDVHLNAGVSCYSCHGQIVSMPVVYQHESLAMGWCLDCHRQPEQKLVPPDRVTQLVWVENQWMDLPVDQRNDAGQTPQSLLSDLSTAPPQNCGACHQ